jgi:hypothetical protein
LLIIVCLGLFILCMIWAIKDDKEKLDDMSDDLREERIDTLFLAEDCYKEEKLKYMNNRKKIKEIKQYEKVLEENKKKLYVFPIAKQENI